MSKISCFVHFLQKFEVMHAVPMKIIGTALAVPAVLDYASAPYKSFEYIRTLYDLS